MGAELHANMRQRRIATQHAVSNVKCWIIVLKVHYEYDYNGHKRPEIIDHLPIQILSESYPNEEFKMLL